MVTATTLVAFTAALVFLLAQLRASKREFGHYLPRDSQGDIRPTTAIRTAPTRKG